MSGRKQMRNANSKRRPRGITRMQPRRGARSKLVANEIYAIGYPREMKVRLRYEQFLNGATTGGLNLDRVYNLNSAFDPYRTGTGTQPRVFDQWAALYGRYIVTRCDVKATFTNAPSDGAICSLLANNDATNITLLSDITESPFSKWKPMTLGGNAVTLTASYDLNKVTGVPFSVYRNDDRYQAVCSADPSEILAGHVGFNSISAFTTAQYVVLTQWITFFDPIQVAPSLTKQIDSKREVEQDKEELVEEEESTQYTTIRKLIKDELKEIKPQPWFK